MTPYDFNCTRCERPGSFRRGGITRRGCGARAGVDLAHDEAIAALVAELRCAEPASGELAMDFSRLGRADGLESALRFLERT